MTDAQKLKLKLKLIATAVAFGLIAYSNAPQFEDRVSAFSSGPPASHTGAPGEQTCTVCHFGGDQLKASKFLGGNGIVIGGLPTAYVPSTAYVLTATLTHTQSPNNTMYGFQLTAVEGTGSTPGAFSLTHMPGQMQIVPGDPPTFVNRSYIQHTISGTVPAANGSKTWQFTWTAPSTDVGPITFHAAGNAADQSGDETGDIIYVTSATVNPEAPAPEGTAFDFDGDSKTDVSIFRPGPGEWWYLRSSDGGNYAAQFGSGTDTLAPADYTGDGKVDIAFFRPSSGEWFVLRSEDESFFSFPFGASGDIPVPGDYDGDGVADPAVFRPSTNTWFINNSGGGTTIQGFGIAGDQPVVSDYDGDGKDDIGIFRPSLSEWWINRSQDGLLALQFGSSGDRPTPADFTGDGKDDVAFFRENSGEWFVLRSEDFSFFSFPFGTSGDIPVPGDYDGDGVADPAVFRPTNNTWFKSQSTNGFEAVQFGIANDIPVPSAFLP